MYDKNLEIWRSQVTLLEHIGIMFLRYSSDSLSSSNPPSFLIPENR